MYIIKFHYTCYIRPIFIRWEAEVSLASPYPEVHVGNVSSIIISYTNAKLNFND